MPYPYQITDSGGLAPAFPLAHYGPYEYIDPVSGGNTLYVVFPETVAGPISQIRVWESTDDGVTWAEVDPGDRITTATNYYDAQVVLEDNTLHIAYLDSSNQINIKPFDMATRSYGANISGGPTVAINAFDPVTPQARKFGLVRLSTGTYVVHYQTNENVGGTNYTRVYYATYSGGWSAGTQVDTNNTGLARYSGLLGIALGTSDRVHFIWWDQTWWSFMTRSRSSGGTLSSIHNVNSDLFAAPYGNPLSAPITYEDPCGNDVIALAYGHYGLGTYAELSATTLKPAHVEFRSEENARFRKDVYPLTTDGPSDYDPTGDDQAMSLLWDEDTATLYAFWASKGGATGADYKIMHAANEGAGWGTPVMLFNAGSGSDPANFRVSRVWARKIQAGVGIIINCETTGYYYDQPYYWQGSLSATAPAFCPGDSSPATNYGRYGYFG